MKEQLCGLGAALQESYLEKATVCFSLKTEQKVLTCSK